MQQDLPISISPEGYIETKLVCLQCKGAGHIRTPEGGDQGYVCPEVSGCGGKGYTLVRGTLFTGLRVVPDTKRVHKYYNGTSVPYDEFLKGARPA